MIITTAIKTIAMNDDDDDDDDGDGLFVFLGVLYVYLAAVVRMATDASVWPVSEKTYTVSSGTLNSTIP